MREVEFYKKLNGNVQCNICPRNCTIAEGKKGFCGVRQNDDGKLYLLVYGKSCSTAIDPIEKKPLFHFMPGHDSFSIATVGCNLRCQHCQNWEISQAKVILGQDLMPEDVVKQALEAGCKSISYTYTEPTIFYEYALDTAKLAKKKGLKNVIVSNGFTNEEPLKEWSKYIDAANIDLKGDKEFYKKISSAWVEPVLNSLKLYKELNVWLEITNLIIPTLNDDYKKIEDMCKWIKGNLGVDVPLHFSRFFPMYKLNGLESTPEETLLKARETAKKVGINYVYVGNMPSADLENTYCPKCNNLLIRRLGFSVVENNIKDGKCSCGGKIAGVWG